MSSTIKELSLNYDPVNETNTFTNGDVVQGRVFLEVAKEAKIDSFYIKCKGDADVEWTESDDDDSDTYHSHERYFKLKQVFIQDPSKPAKNEPNVILSVGETYGNVVRPGRHVYPFSFQLPHGNMPPSCKGYHGSVKYVLEVRVDRSWKKDRTAKTEINFIPRIGVGANLMSPQSAATDKKMKLFTSGSASLRATVDKKGYMQGDVIRVSTNVENSSSRELKLKYSLEQKQAFYAQGHSKFSSKTIFKVVGDPIPTRSKQTVNKDLRIPPNLELTISNCSIIKLEYVLKVYLDVPYASDPEVKFPVVLLPTAQLLGSWQSQPGFPPYGPIPSPQAPFGPSPPTQTAFGPSPPPQAAFGPNPPPQAAFGPNPPPQAAFGPSPPPQAAFGPNPPPHAAFGPSPPPQTAFGPSPPPQTAFGPSPPPQAAFGPSPPPQAAFGPSPPPQTAFGPGPPGAAFGLAPGLYPSLYPSPAGPQPVNAEAPPPSYVYPNQNPTVPGFQPPPSAPSFNPPYSAVGYPGPAVPQQYPAPRVSEFCPNPSAPPYSQTEGTKGH